MNSKQFFTPQKWWGKLIGAFFGFLIGGPVGALLGIFVGNFFDRGLAEYFSHPFFHYHRENRAQIQRLFFEATFAVMGYMAKADGRVSQKEIAMANQLMRDLKLTAKQKQEARNLFNHGKSPGFDIKETLTSLRALANENTQLLKLFVDIQYQAAQVDQLTAKKFEAMNTILRYLGFAPLVEQFRFYEDFSFRGGYQRQSSQQSEQERAHQSSSSSYRSYQQRPTNSLEHAYAVLEISSHATKQEVKRAYRRLISQNHPDKLIAKGLPEAMIKVATDKTQKIRKAYEQICENKGW